MDTQLLVEKLQDLGLTKIHTNMPEKKDLHGVVNLPTNASLSDNLIHGIQYVHIIIAGLDKDEPYLDKAPNYERDYKSGKYVIVNNFKNAEQNSDNAQKAILPRLWSTEHVENYIQFTGVPKFKLNQDYPYEEDLAQYGVNLDSLSEEQVGQAVNQLKEEMQKNINEFKSAYAQNKIDNEDYVSFLKKYSDYLTVEKPSTWDNISFRKQEC
jgi:hypothetical protein